MCFASKARRHAASDDWVERSADRPMRRVRFSRTLTCMAISNIITVYISCPKCEVVYLTKQVRVPIPANGRFDCIECNGLVYSWSGLYDYFHWEPLMHRT